MWAHNMCCDAGPCNALHADAAATMHITDLRQLTWCGGADDDEVMVGMLSEQELAAVNVPDLEYR